MKAEIHNRAGRLTLFVDDVPYPAYAYYMPHPDPVDIRLMAKRGVHLFTWGFSDLIPHSMDMGWIGPDCFDFSRVDREANAILEADPEALLLPRIAVSAPKWWLEAHPEDNIHYQSASEQPSGHTSLASEAWRQEAGRAFQLLIRHMEEASYGSRIIGYQVTGGRNEWFYTFGSDFADYSPAAVAAWRRWLKAEYHNNLDELRDAWGSEVSAEFEEIKVPTSEERLATPTGLLWDPAISRRIPDYWRFLAETTADAFIYFCRLVRETTKTPKLTGGFYGYTLNNMGSLAEGRIPLNTGHLALGRVLKAPEVDFLASPYQMTYRFEGGYDGDQLPTASLRLHGKFLFAEITRGPFPACRSRHDEVPVEDGLAIMKRNLATRLIEGSGMWWMEWNGGDFRPKLVQEVVGAARPLFDQIQTPVGESVTEIAVVVDEGASFWIRPGWEFQYPFVFLQERAGLARIGAPFDVHLLDDLAHAAFSPKKLYVFLNCVRITSVQRRVIHERLARDDATALWFYGAGVIDERSLDPKNASKTVGMALGESRSGDSPLGGPVHQYLIDFEHPVTHGLPPGGIFGTTAPLSPLYFCEDPDATPLGRMFSTHGLERVGLAVKEQKGWTSVFCAVPNMPAPMFRNIARMAGCHIYSDEDDVVRANDSHLCVHVKKGGKKIFQLPKPRDVTDVFDGRVVAQNSTRIQDEIPNAGTRLYRLDPPSV